MGDSNLGFCLLSRALCKLDGVSSELCGVKTPDNQRSFRPTALRRVETVAKFTLPIGCPVLEGLRPTPLHMRLRYPDQQVSYDILPAYIACYGVF